MQFRTKLGLVDIPNDEVIAAADAIQSPAREVTLMRRINALAASLQAIADESQRHHEHNPISGVDRLPQGYVKILNLATAALN